MEEVISSVFFLFEVVLCSKPVNHPGCSGRMSVETGSIYCIVRV